MATFELTKDYLETLEAAISADNKQFLVSELEELFPADISSILYELDGVNAHYIFSLLDTEKGAEVLSNIETDDRKKFIKEQFTVAEIAKYVNLFDSDDAVDLLNEESIEVREKVIAMLEDREHARFILDLLHYPEDVAGGLMQKELIKVNISQTVSECVEEIRAQAENVDKVYAVYVVDNEQKLKGIVSLKQIVLARKNSKIENIFEDDIVYVDTTQSGDEVAQIMQKYDLEAIPVVNSLGRLLGVITIDDVVDFITEKAEEDIQVMAGITGEAEEDDSVWQLAKSRIPWLVVGVIGSLLAATVISQFEETLARVAALAMFIPLMGSTGGNVGIQTSSLIVQSLAEKSALSLGIWERLGKVLKVAIINGIVVGLIAGAFVMIEGEPEIFWVVCFSLISVVLLSSFMGTVTPLLLNKLGINPAIASGPFITTANDIIGITTYFLIAYYLLNL
ncbi:MAG: magnesium transporter [Cytophagaceae bacterium]|nr:magnesium transporter [Cytophagaceae bacterium]MBK9511268.1 magnesium transporter [Cytophagaceae bacterium]MBK9932796.1 magnesium transporter [Cytophagaceae bacterium]MBL0303516.1 magnesium transporter [Cytophagaceae bacterium]MBL0326342.1 magnesium transporter [Cytophagaceae bacterium]